MKTLFLIGIGFGLLTCFASMLLIGLIQRGKRQRSFLLPRFAARTQPAYPFQFPPPSPYTASHYDLLSRALARSESDDDDETESEMNECSCEESPPPGWQGQMSAEQAEAIRRGALYQALEQENITLPPFLRSYLDARIADQHDPCALTFQRRTGIRLSRWYVLEDAKDQKSDWN